MAATQPARPFDASRVARWRPAGFDADACALPTIEAVDARPILPDLDL